tara:strand:- start:782 stop:1315 length:534 start_codon:yes stop_codon:yes gene_type:complete
MHRQNTYNEDRNDSDNFFYNSKEVINIINQSELYGEPVESLEPACEEDDGCKVTDTWINNKPVQVRVQFVENKKTTNQYYPTIRYIRRCEKTEIVKLIQMFQKGEKIPDLMWLLIQKNEIKQLIIVDLEKIIRERTQKHKKDSKYNLTMDYQVKNNTDGQTSFLILDNEDDYLFEYP